MVMIKIFREKNRIKGFEIKGHAMANQDDTFDLVCAGVSSIALTALTGLVEYLQLKDLEPEIKEGYIFCMLPIELNEVLDIKAQAILETMILGLQGISMEYKNCVKFI